MSTESLVSAQAWILRALFALSTATCAIVACSGPDPDDTGMGPPDAASTDGTTSTTTNGDAASPTDAATADVAAHDAKSVDVADAEADADIPDADVPDVQEAGPAVPISDPLAVGCGASSCNTSPDVHELCCLAGETCVKSLSQCLGVDYAMCDEAADCTAGWTCCGPTPSVGPNKKFNSRCFFGDAGVCEFNGGVQLCKTEAECHGAPCTEKTCAGHSFFSCGPVPFGFCQ